MPLQTSFQFHIDRIQAYLEAGSSNLLLSHGYEVVNNTPRQRAKRFKESIENLFLRLGQIIDDPNGDVEVLVPWIPKTTDIRIQQHFTRLQIPTLDHKPSLLLHGLGDPDAFDFATPRHASQPSRPSRATVFRSIFPAGPSSVDAKHSVLFNTSGAGKTRLILQGLCDEWGFYLTCSRQASEVGSADIENVLHPRIGHLKICGLIEHPSSLLEFEKNEQHAERCFIAVLTARFVVLLCLLAAFEVRFGVPTAGQISVLRKLWLFVQLDTRLLGQPGHPDILSELTTLLCHVEKHDTLITDYVRLFNICKEFLGPATRIYCVLDEAQTAANSYQSAFLNSDRNQERPTLRAMLRIWSDLGMQHVTTGTSLNLEHINDALSSTILKYANVPKKAVTETGSFVEEPDQVEGFLRYYLPSWLVESESGKELIERAKYWLYGRPRFITSYVTCLIENHFKCPHQVLTKHIKNITNFVPADAKFWEDLEDSINAQSEEPEVDGQSISVLEPFDLSRGE
ncbi:hypothetical protein C0992_004427 [Termitomyces sp. T32_za158]|nr:hypothetical protein C0992_004427 [Termitomyces sp. T32_za158]